MVIGEYSPVQKNLTLDVVWYLLS